MKQIVYTVLLFLSVSLFSCKKAMEEVTIEKSLNEFDTLTVNSVFEIQLTQGSSNSIRIEGAQKILENVEIAIENNTLTLSNSFKGNWLYPKKNKVRVYITTNGLHRINSNETSNIRTTNKLTGNEIGLVMTSKLNEANLAIDCNSFYFWNNHPCGGKVVLTGQTNELKVWSYALMAIDASDLNTPIASVENNSKGDCRIYCTTKLTYSILGTGNIYLSGDPTEIIKIEESSTGQLIQ
ncbi:MAG: GIN domain-containing protein [Flavobacteriia bacterium]